MKKINIPLLKKICETAGVPGYEQRIRDLVLQEITPLVDNVSTDNIGNVTAFKKGKVGRKVAVAAHMDEIGFIVTHIDDDGFVRVHPLGGFDPKTLNSQRVIIHGDKDVIGVMACSKPIHLMSPEETEKVPKCSDYFIDLGMNRKSVEKAVSIGDPVTRERELIEMGDCVNCKSIDNRISVYILIETLRSLRDQEVPFDVYGVFTVQEEVGIRGGNVAALEIQPEFGIGLDTTVAYDLPGAKGHEVITRLGEGAAIKVLDASAISDYRMVNFMKQVASRHKIDYQMEILTAGGTDAAGLQRMTPGGSIAGAISIPTRHLHQVIEMAHKKDITDCIKLLSHCLTCMNEFDWSQHPTKHRQ